MKLSFKDVPTLNEDWDFWFEHTKKIPKSNKINIKKNKDSYCFILNNDTKEIDYVSESVQDVLGYSREEYNIELLFSIIHPEDLEYCRVCEFNCIQVNNNFYYNEHFRYSFHYSYRVLAKNGQYITIQQKYQTIEVDDYGHLYKTLVLHEVIDSDTTRPEDDFRIYDKLKSRSINIPNKYKLTKRELEILELIYQGYRSSEISEMLFLSKYTVGTHRKNILHKTKSATWLELINKGKGI